MDATVIEASGLGTILRKSPGAASDTPGMPDGGVGVAGPPSSPTCSQVCASQTSIVPPAPVVRRCRPSPVNAASGMKKAAVGSVPISAPPVRPTSHAVVVPLSLPGGDPGAVRGERDVTDAAASVDRRQGDHLAPTAFDEAPDLGRAVGTGGRQPGRVGAPVEGGGPKDPWPASTIRCRPSRPRTRAPPSSLTATDAPSGLHATSVTPNMWPSSVSISAPEATSRTTAIGSATDDTTSRAPSGENEVASGRGMNPSS